MYQEQVPSYKHFDEPLDKRRFVFECILPGNLQALTGLYYVWTQLFHVQAYPGKFCFLLQNKNKMFIPSNPY